MSWLNETKRLMALRLADPPKYASKPLYEAILGFLGFPCNWVERGQFCFWNEEEGAKIGNSPGDIFYDRREFWAEDSCAEYHYIHDLCHALTARGLRGDWKEHPNFGCIDGDEEVEVCYLQWFIMWELAKLPTEYILDTMDLYSFFQDIAYDMDNWRNCREIRREAKRLVELGRKKFLSLLSTEERGILKRLSNDIPNVDRRKRA